jgi:hypothetical protein
VLRKGSATNEVAEKVEIEASGARAPSGNLRLVAGLKNLWENSKVARPAAEAARFICPNLSRGLKPALPRINAGAPTAQLNASLTITQTLKPRPSRFSASCNAATILVVLRRSWSYGLHTSAICATGEIPQTATAY